MADGLIQFWVYLLSDKYIVYIFMGNVFILTIRSYKYLVIILNTIIVNILYVPILFKISDFKFQVFNNLTSRSNHKM